MAVVEKNSVSGINQKQLYRDCFYALIEDNNKYKPVYNVKGMKLDRRTFLLCVGAYYDAYATIEEKRIYNKIINGQKNNKFEQLKNKYRESFIMYLKGEDTEDYYISLAEQSRISVETAKRYPFHYYDKYASDEEREIFDQVRLAKKEQDNSEKEEATKMKLKHMFDTCVQSNFDEEKIDNLTETYSISPKTVKNYINSYYDRYANDEEKEQYNIAKQKQKENNARYVKIFNHILKMKKIEDILLYLVNQKNLNRTYLKTSINPYIMSYPDVDVARLNQIVDTYYNYISYRNKKEELAKKKIEQTNREIEREKQVVNIKIEKQKQLLLQLIKLVKKYNSSEYSSYVEFCQKNKIDLNRFEHALKLTAKIDKKTYAIFINKTRKQNREKYGKEYLVMQELVEGLKTNKKFGLLDYYNITKMSLDELNIIAKKICNSEDYKIFEEFYQKYRNERTINPATLIKASYMISSYGDQIELDDKTRLSIIANLKKQNTPINKVTYLEAIKKEIEKCESMQKVKVA